VRETAKLDYTSSLRYLFIWGEERMTFKLRLIVLGLVVGVFSSGVQAQDRSMVMSYKTDTAPVIDGEIDGSEWDAAGPWIVVNPDSPNVQAGVDLIEDDVYGGAEDASFRFKTMWVEDTANFYIVYEVFDDIAMEANSRNPWEVDQIESFFDGTNLDGDEDVNSYHWWDNEETYGKFGVSRNNTFEGNVGNMTDDESIWDEGFGLAAYSAVADMETNADYRIELAVSIIPMIDDPVFAPYADSPTEDASAIVEDSTTIKYTAAVSDDDNFDTGDTERSHVLTYYREVDGVEGAWDNSTAFATLMFTGEWDGTIVEPIPGDCNNDGALTAADLDCQTADTLGDTLDALGILAGDFNADGEVAFNDFLTLSSGFNMPGVYSQGDANGDGQVAFADFLLLSGNFGKDFAAAAAVPEPSALALAGLGFLALGTLRRRR